MSLLHLPNELVFQISGDLCPVDLYALLRVNHALFCLLYDSLLDTACDENRGEGCCGEYENRSRDLLHSAAQRGDKELVKLVVSKGILNVVDTARLLIRVLKRRKCNDALRILLECGVDPLAYPRHDEMNVRGLPMRYAVTHGRAKALEIMLDVGEVDINGYLYQDVTLLHLAVEHRQTAVIQALLARKDIDVNRLGLVDDCTPLYHAVRWVDRSEDATRVLLADPRVDVNWCDTEFQTPLHVAADFGGEQLLKTLLAHPKIDLNVRDKLGQTPLHFSVRIGDCRLIRFFLEDKRLAPRQHHGTLGNPLHAAVGSCQLPALRLLLDDGRFDVNSTDENGDTPLHIAIQKGDREDLVLLLLSRANVDVEMRNNEGRSSSDLAASQNRLVVKRAMEKYSHGKRQVIGLRGQRRKRAKFRGYDL
ncbi:unnamed protein product [Tuber aestivum]|uniref:Uncharacterized protein n=1 Tax=Tuber aestivum TaxID=59557 RepID=A0A292PS47_9PEZI|nr:unnamed protein product [Tuber aestivum]